MRLKWCADVSAADWLARSTTPAMQLLTCGPCDFPAFARLRYIPDPTAPGQKETDTEVPDDHPSDIEQARRVLRLLAPSTSTPQDCYFCLWEGYSDAPLPTQVQRGPLVELPERRYALLRGALTDIDYWETDLGDGLPIAPPAFVWPADHRWCFASDVDPHWAGISAEQNAINTLIRDPQLDVVPADPADNHPFFS